MVSRLSNAVSPLKITTVRLDLISGTPELANADIYDRSQFATLLGARVPDEWPPPLNDIDSMKWFESYLDEHPDGVGWVTWYFILREDESGKRVVIGNGGFKGRPTPDGTVEVGYSIIKDFQNCGYATEATSGLLKWAFGHPEVTRVLAETYPILKKSIRVLEKIGFVFMGVGSEDGVICYSVSLHDFLSGIPTTDREQR